MAAPASPSSDDPETLKALLAEERAENERLRQIIKEMQRHRFGRRAETLPEDQMLLGLEEAEQVEAAGYAAEEIEPARKEARSASSAARTAERCRPTCRGSRRLVDIESSACPCCSGTLHRIGEDVSERLDIVPAQFRVLVIRRPKYACRACEDVVVQAPAPARLIEGGLPTEATGRPGPGLQICRSPAALPAGPDLRPPGRQPRPLDAGRLGRARRLPAAARARAAAG